MLDVAHRRALASLSFRLRRTFLLLLPLAIHDTALVASMVREPRSINYSALKLFDEHLDRLQRRVDGGDGPERDERPVERFCRSGEVADAHVQQRRV